MNSVALNFFLHALARVLLGSDAFDRLKAIVVRQEERARANPALTGDDKFDAAVAEARVIGIQAAGLLLNVGIELAVVWLKKVAK